MPRVKTTPNRKASNDHEISQNIGNESVLDDEEIERLEQELESLRREKAKQIRKMRFRREENRHLCYGSTESSSEGAEEQYSEQYEDEDQNIEPAVEARQSTRDLADGFEKAHKRFMFNVQNLEQKYAEREQRGLPESHIEIDRYGNFYFPENMVPSRQQTFVNRMFQYHSLFGKGSVSAPRNSIQSFDGDHHALKRSLQLDEKFGKKERETEQYGNRFQKKKCRIISSSYVSGIPKVEFYSTSSCSSRYNSRYPEDMDDDVFFQPREKRESFEYPSRETRVDRDPTTSTRTFFPNKTKNESEEEESVEDEESTAGESSEESLCDEDDTDEDEEEKFEDEEKEETDKKGLASRVEKSIKIEVQGSCETAIHLKQSKARTSFTESENPSVVGTPRISKTSVTSARCLNAIKAEPSQINEIQHGVLVPKPPLKTQSGLNNAVLAIKKEPGTEIHTISITPTVTNGSSFLAPQLTTEIHVPNSSIIGFEKKITMKDHPKTPPSSTRLSTPRRTGDTKYIKSVLGEEPLKGISVSNTVKHQQVLPNDHHKKNGVELAVAGEEEQINLPAMALSERPKRKIKPTEKVATLASIHHSIDHNLTTEHNSKKQEKCSNGKRQKRKSSPYCKHCELIEEEKRKAKLESKVNNALETNVSMNSNLGVSEPVGSKPNALKDQSTRNGGGREGVNAPKRLSTQSKRPSGTVASNEPEKKKQKLIDSDLLSIPSSLAIIVDTELIAAENPSLDSSNIPKFSENSPTVSIWDSTVDIQWIKDVKIARGKTKNRQFFGVPVAEYPTDIPVINFWVDNLFCEQTTKDRFATDYRRYMAQGSKARKDGKAGYDVR